MSEQKKHHLVRAILAIEIAMIVIAIAVPVTETVTESKSGNLNNLTKLNLVNLILNRVNHLEGILSSSLFTLMISTTLAVCGGAYAMKDGAKVVPISGRTFFIGVNGFYVLLSAHYYFMLTHFYSAFMFLIDINDPNHPLIKNLNILWISFRIPAPLPANVKSFLYLIQATLPPLLFASFTAIGIYFLFLKSDKITTADDTAPPEWLFVALATHLLVWAGMVLHPFLDFMNALNRAVPKS